jgi:hypothetical protein
MTDREIVLRRIEVGDIFNAEDATGPVRTCLTIFVTGTTIHARSITTQEVIEFDRKTGVATHSWHSARYEYVISSVAPLPADIHRTMLSVDLKFRDVGHEPEREGKMAKSALSKEQIRGLLFVEDFFRAHPLPA